MPKEEPSPKVEAQRKMKLERQRAPEKAPVLPSNVPEFSPLAYEEVKKRALALGVWGLVSDLLRVSRG